MQPFFEKMKEYLSMDTEISFGEFRDYFQAVIDELKKSFDTIQEEDAFHALFILYNLESNSELRSKRKAPEAKKYKKMRETSNLWVSALNLKLNKLGFDETAISERIDSISQAV